MTARESALLASIRKSRDPNKLRKMLRDLGKDREEQSDVLLGAEENGDLELAIACRKGLALIDQDEAALKEFGRTELCMEIA